MRRAGADERRDQREVEGERARDRRDDVVGIAEVPGQAVEVAEDVAAGAGRVAVAGGDGRVVEERPPLDHARRLGVEHRDVATSRRWRTSTTEMRVVEAGEHVEQAAARVERQPGRAAAGHRDLVRLRRDERVVLELARREDADLARAERRDVAASCRPGVTTISVGKARLLAASSGVPSWLKSMCLLRCRGVTCPVRGIDGGDAALGEVTANRSRGRPLRRAEGVVPFEPHVVAGVGVGRRRPFR